MTVVVDLGCYTHPAYPEDESTLKLIGRFWPDRYYGFDPHPDMGYARKRIDGCGVELVNVAAWTCDGLVPFDRSAGRPLAANIRGGGEQVRCIDIAAKLRELGPGLVVKVDIEGAEYDVLDHVIADGADRMIGRLLVEWHQPPVGPPDWEERRDGISRSLRCVVAAWE